MFQLFTTNFWILIYKHYFSYVRKLIIFVIFCLTRLPIFSVIKYIYCFSTIVKLSQTSFIKQPEMLLSVIALITVLTISSERALCTGSIKVNVCKDNTVSGSSENLKLADCFFLKIIILIYPHII